MNILKALLYGGLVSTVLFAQEGPNAPTLFYPGAHVVADQIPRPDGQVPAWFLIEVPGVPAYLGRVFTLDLRSISVTLNGRVLTAKCDDYNGIQGCPTQPEYALELLNPTTALLVLNPAVYHAGDRVRVSYAYVSN